MSFLSEIFDFMFAPAGAFDSDSGPSPDISSDNDFFEHESVMVNPANGMPMVEGSGGIGGVDVTGNLWGHSDMFSDHGCDSSIDHSSGSFDSSSMFDSAPMFDSGSMFDCGSPSFGTGFDD
jgi:hypothetical protein